jgi:hypothetical protein
MARFVGVTPSGSPERMRRTTAATGRRSAGPDGGAGAAVSAMDVMHLMVTRDRNVGHRRRREGAKGIPLGLGRA